MDSSADSALTVFAWGNISRGDDAIGPILAKFLRDIAPPDVRIVEDHQLNIEHVTDLSRDGLALFLDASVAIPSGCRLSRVWPVSDSNFSTHAISPQALLNVYEQTMKQQAPDAWLLHVAAREFELGEGIGNIAAQAIDEAAQLLKALVACPPEGWREFLVQNEARLPAVSMSDSAG